MSIKQNGGVFGRNPTFNDVTIEGDLIINGEVFSGLDFQGSWNASTNSPALVSSTGTKGEFYIVSVAGTTSLDGITNWGIGDWALFNGTVWQRVEGGADGNFVNLSASGTSTLTGNVGLGTSPLAWHSDYKGLNVGAGASMYGRLGSNEAVFSTNFYRDSAAVFKRINVGFATSLVQHGGNYYWYTAPTGAADSTVTFTESMLLDPSGNLSILGALSKGSGSFKITHPLESKADTHSLVHSFVESPQADNIYRGKVALSSGTATVNIDSVAGMTEGTFSALNREIQVFTSNESTWDAVKGVVDGNILTISSKALSSSATVSWMVIGERKDQHMYDTHWTDDNGKVIVEPEIVSKLNDEIS